MRPKETPETVGGWIWYIRMWKEAHPGRDVDHKALMQLYVRGVSYDA